MIPGPAVDIRQMMQSLLARFDSLERSNDLLTRSNERLSNEVQDLRARRTVADALPPSPTPVRKKRWVPRYPADYGRGNKFLHPLGPRSEIPKKYGFAADADFAKITSWSMKFEYPAVASTLYYLQNLMVYLGDLAPDAEEDLGPEVFSWERAMNTLEDSIKTSRTVAI